MTVQAMLRGESLGMSEGVPALVEHQGGMMMIEPGSGQQSDSWAQDVPAAMRTPSLEARQVGACRVLCAVCMHRARLHHARSLFTASLPAALLEASICDHSDPDCIRLNLRHSCCACPNLP